MTVHRRLQHPSAARYRLCLVLLPLLTLACLPGVFGSSSSTSPGSATHPPPALPVDGYVFPVRGYNGTVGLHHGSGIGAADLSGAPGTPIDAMRGGRVTRAGWQASGWSVHISADGLHYYYTHLLKPPLVREGEYVPTGRQIGELGESGNAAGTGPHLHLGIGPYIIAGWGPNGGAGAYDPFGKQYFDAVGLLRRVLASSRTQRVPEPQQPTRDTSGCVTLHAGKGYTGSQLIVPVPHDISALNRFPLQTRGNTSWNDRAMSLRVPAGVQVTAFSDFSYEGANRRWDHDVPNTQDPAIKESGLTSGYVTWISSLRVRGTAACLFQEPTPVPGEPITDGQEPTPDTSWLPDFSSASLVDQWVKAPIDGAFYDAAHWAASHLWGDLRSGFSLVLILDGLRLTVTSQGFRPLVDGLVDQIRPLLLPALILGLLLSVLSQLLSSVISLSLAKLRTVLLAALLFPVLLGSVSVYAAWGDDIRTQVASGLFDLGWTKGAFDSLAPGGPADEQLGGGTFADGRHGIDVAARYILAAPSDVYASADLPAEFREAFFPHDSDEFEAMEPTERDQALNVAYRGVGRLLRGFAMMGLASLEAIGNLAWTLAFWTLAIAMLLCAVFVWFPPVEAMIIGLGRRWLQTFLASWGASLVFGLFMALLFRVAETGNAVAVLGMGIVVSVVALAFTLMALWMFAGALLSIFTVATGGVLMARHLQNATHLAQQGAANVGGIVRGAATGTTKLLEGADEAGIAYKAARNLGADRRYSAAYAAPVVRAAGLARAMGMTLPEPVDRAIQTRAAAAREPLSGRAMAAVDRGRKSTQAQAAEGRCIVRYLFLLVPLLWFVPLSPAQQVTPSGHPGVVIPKQANVRNMPTLAGSKVLHQLPQGTTVRIVGCYGSWYAVTLPEHGHARAWMHHSVLNVDPALAATIPVIGPDLQWPTEPTPDPLAALNQAAIAELPPDAETQGAPAVVPLMVCYDANATRTCDAGEGIQGALAIVTKQRTASIIGEAETDARGVAALQVPVQAGDVLDVNVPHLGWTQTLQINEGRVPTLPPLVVQAAGPLPWPLP